MPVWAVGGLVARAAMPFSFFCIMNVFSVFGRIAHRVAGPGRRAGLVAGLGLLLSWLLPNVAQATHLRAGDIQAILDTSARPNPRRVFFRMTIYRDRAGDGN